MRSLWCWYLPHGKRASLRACLTKRQPRPASERQASPLTCVQEDRLRTMPRWKRFVLMYIVLVCLAMVWHLVVALGFLVDCLLVSEFLRL